MEVDLNLQVDQGEQARAAQLMEGEANEDRHGPEISSKEPIKEYTVISVEETKGMQIDSSNPSLYSDFKDSCMISVSQMNNCNNDELLNIESITATIPSLDLNYEDAPLGLKYLVPSTPACHYILRSLDKKHVIPKPDGGLGPSSSQAFKRKARGRKSNLSKAQVKAKYDVADGKQMSIPGALRAENPKENVIK